MASASGPDDATLRAALREHIAAGGSVWQLASWALMLGDADDARRRVRAGADAARERWHASLPPKTGLRWFSRDQAMPNQNFVREHFGLALVLADESAMRETSSALAAWLTTWEEMLRRKGSMSGVGPTRYAHNPGYLDLLAVLLGRHGERPTREQALHAGGGPPSTRVAVVALVEGDAAMLQRGVNGVLAEHAKTLERKSSPPPPVSDAAVHLAAAARRLGIPVQVEDRWARHRVPIDVRAPTGERQRGRLPADLLGRALWDG